MNSMANKSYSNGNTTIHWSASISEALLLWESNSTILVEFAVYFANAPLRLVKIYRREFKQVSFYLDARL